jgi:Tfp pilus assembly protein PilV
MRTRAPAGSAAGFTILDALIAMTMVLVAAGTLLQLAGGAMHANREARRSTLASVLAAEMLEQLRSLSSGSRGEALDSSPPGTLDQNVEGFCEFFDGRGTLVPAGDQGAGSTLVRRWSVQALPADPARLVLQVVVLPTVDAMQGAARGANGRRLHLVTIKLRRVS